MALPRSIQLPYEPREAFISFHNRQARWGTEVCHRRSGKTVAAVNDLIIGGVECPLPRPQLAYIGPTYSQTKRIAWEYLKHFAAPLIESSNETELTVQLKYNQAKIFLLGAEKMDNLRGLYLDGAILDEYAQIKPAAYGQVIRPALADRNGWAVFMGTPKGKNHFYDQYNKSKADPTQYSLLLKASESGIIPAEELAELKRTMDASDYAQEFECSFDAALKGAIFGEQMELAEKEGRIKEIPFDSALALDVVCDLGYTDDTVLGFFQITPYGQIVMHEVLISNEMEWPDYLDEMDNREVRDIWLPHDARAKNLQTGRSIVEQTLTRGYTPKMVPDHKLRDGISAAKKLLPYTYWNQPLCSGAIEAMKSYRKAWDEKLNCFRDRPVHDWASHTADMFRYLGVVCESLKPERRIILPREQQIQEMNYSFNLEDLFTDPRTNPGLYRRN